MYTQQWQHANKGGGKCNLSANINFCSVWLCLTLIWLLDCNWPMAGQWVILKNTSMQFDLNYYLPAAKWTSPVLPDCRSAVSSVRVCIVSPCPPPLLRHAGQVWTPPRFDVNVTLLCLCSAKMTDHLFRVFLPPFAQCMLETFLPRKTTALVVYSKT